MKNLIEKINEAPLLSKEKVQNALNSFNEDMEKATFNFKKQQADCETKAKDAYLTK